MSGGRSSRKVVGYLTLASILVTVGVVVLWDRPGWSAAEASKRLPAVPSTVIAEYKRCHENLEQCEPIPVAETRTFTFAFEPVRTVQGWWAGSAAQFSWDYGRLSAETCAMCVHGKYPRLVGWPSRFVIGNTDTEMVTPYVRVVIPNLRDDQLHRRITASAHLSVRYPEKVGSTRFVDSSVQLSQTFRLFPVTPDEMQLLRQSVAAPFGARGVVVVVLLVMDLLGLLVFLRMRRRGVGGRASPGAARRPSHAR